MVDAEAGHFPGSFHGTESGVSSLTSVVGFGAPTPHLSSWIDCWDAGAWHRAEQCQWLPWQPPVVLSLKRLHYEIRTKLFKSMRSICQTKDKRGRENKKTGSKELEQSNQPGQRLLHVSPNGVGGDQFRRGHHLGVGRPLRYGWGGGGGAWRVTVAAVARHTVLLQGPTGCGRGGGGGGAAARTAVRFPRAQHILRAVQHQLTSLWNTIKHRLNNKINSIFSKINSIFTKINSIFTKIK